MKKRLVAVLLVAAMSVSLLTACHDSSESKATIDIKQTDYDPEEAVKDFEFGELNETEKNYTVEMGYNNCDHMVAAIIGEKAGIYEAMGLKVNLTKSGETTKALISGAMDVGYIHHTLSHLLTIPVVLVTWLSAMIFLTLLKSKERHLQCQLSQLKTLNGVDGQETTMYHTMQKIIILFLWDSRMRCSL